MRGVDDPRVLATLRQRLSALAPDTPRRWGTMTANEMLCHLGDAAAGVLANPGRGSGRRKPIVKWVALYAPVPWPHGVRTLPSVDPRRDGTRPTDFERDRNRALAGLERLAVAGADDLPLSHSMFGRMDRRDWMRWAWRHTDHHLRQFGL